MFYVITFTCVVTLIKTRPPLCNSTMPTTDRCPLHVSLLAHYACRVALLPLNRPDHIGSQKSGCERIYI